MRKAQGLEGVGFSNGSISLLREEKINVCMETVPRVPSVNKELMFQAVLMA